MGAPEIASALALVISSFTLGKYYGEFRVEVDLLWRIYVEEPLLKYARPSESRYSISREALMKMPGELVAMLDRDIKAFRKYKNDIYKLSFQIYKKYRDKIFEMAHRHGITGRDLIVISALYIVSRDP